MASKSLFESHPVLTLGAIVILAVAADAVARGGGGGGHGSGDRHVGGGSGSGGEPGSSGGGRRSSAPVQSGAFIAHPGTAVRGGQMNVSVNPPMNVHRAAAPHGHVAQHRFTNGGLRAYSYDGCYRWRRIITPFGWTLSRVNVCAAYYDPYYD